LRGGEVIENWVKRQAPTWAKGEEKAKQTGFAECSATNHSKNLSATSPNQW
jgi:hypothetical protein